MHNDTRVRVALAVGALSPMLAVVPMPALAQTCQWARGFQSPGASDPVRALTVFNDGTGPALYAGGDFTAVGEAAANHIVRWNGIQWSALDGGTNGSVLAVAVFDDGTGPALYAGGEFTTASGVTVNRIAKWDGRQWSALGSGTSGSVFALTVFDDGTGPALYVGGWFTTAGGVLVNNIAKWNGTQWSALSTGTNGPVLALTAFDDGAGSALYVGGSFNDIGVHIAKWNGTQWSELGHGLHGGCCVNALTVFDDGTGPALYAGGEFTSTDDIEVKRIAKWDGSRWSALGSGIGGPSLSASVLALTVFDDGTGPALYAGGDFTAAGGVAANYSAKWDGMQWYALGDGMNRPVSGLTVFDDGTGPSLYVAGEFTTAGEVVAGYLAKWDGSQWSVLGDGGGISQLVSALTVFDDGIDTALYAGGTFTTAGGAAANYIARWDGVHWSALGNGMSGNFASVSALAVFNDGSGPALYAGGSFITAGDAAVRNIARWDGTQWSALGSGLRYPVFALAVFDDGSGTALYAGAPPFGAGGVVNIFAKWNGMQWSTFDRGPTSSVNALAVFDDGSGPALYVGGLFTHIGGERFNYIARWDGTQWSHLGRGMDGDFALVAALTVFDDGSGPALYAGGRFTTAGNVAVNNVAKWDGAQWSAVSSLRDGEFPFVATLTVFDNGSGPALYAGGRFITAGDTVVNNIAKWNGSQWSALGSGTNLSVRALTVFADGTGPALYAGGEFTTAGGVTSSRIAAWRCAGL